MTDAGMMLRRLRSARARARDRCAWRALALVAAFDFGLLLGTGL